MARPSRFPGFVAVFLLSVLTLETVGAAPPEVPTPPAPDRIESLRTAVHAWLSKTNADELLISSSTLRPIVVEDWESQCRRYEILSVRAPGAYDSAGHIPHALNIFWPEIVSEENLARLDPDKIIVHYCYYGHGSMISATILNLMGYRSRSLDFGMMGWNLDALVKEPWDREADYPVETARTAPEETFPLPVVAAEARQIQDIVAERARAYLSGEGSPVLTSAAVKAILDDWVHKRVAYQVVDVRSGEAFQGGHLAHAIHIPWRDLAEVANLKMLDPEKTAIVYSENGQVGQLAATVLNLLGYKAVAMKFGMMDWNQAHVDEAERWREAAGYPVETSTHSRESE